MGLDRTPSDQFLDLNSKDVIGGTGRRSCRVSVTNFFFCGGEFVWRASHEMMVREVGPLMVQFLVMQVG